MTKRILAFILCGIMLLCLASCGQGKEDYTAKLVSIMNSKEETSVQDVFSFEFDRAYVLNFEDGYLDGDGFAQKYNLDISISQVEAGKTDNVQRIVFVDEAGNFVFLFQCTMDEIFIESKGVVIDPETVINRSSSQEKPLQITFESADRYGS